MKKLLILLLTIHVANAGERILFLGDSLAFGSFGEKIFQSINAKDGFTLSMYVGCGFQASDWLKENTTSDCGYKYREPGAKSWTNLRNGRVPGLRELVTRINPTMMIVELGGNMYGQLKNVANPMANSKLIEEMKRMKEAALGTGTTARKCMWITPQYTTEDVSLEKQRAFEVIAEKVLKPECETFLSYEPIRQFCEKNGLHAAGHPSTTIYDYWASLVIPKIVEVSGN
jgi:hypothetical protein